MLFESLIQKMKKSIFFVYCNFFIQNLTWSFVWEFVVLLKIHMQKNKKIFSWKSNLCKFSNKNALKPVGRINSIRFERVKGSPDAHGSFPSILQPSNTLVFYFLKSILNWSHSPYSRLILHYAFLPKKFFFIAPLNFFPNKALSFLVWPID